MVKKLLIIVTTLLGVFGFSLCAFAGEKIQMDVLKGMIFFDRNSFSACTGLQFEGAAYYCLKDVANELSGTSSQFDLVWDKESNTVNIVTGRPYPTQPPVGIQLSYEGQKFQAMRSTLSILLDGKTTPIQAYEINQNVYVKLRDLSDLGLFDLEWDKNVNSIMVLSKIPVGAVRVNNNIFQNYDDGQNHVIYVPALIADSCENDDTARSYMFKNNDGTIDVVEVYQNAMSLKRYDSTYKVTFEKSIPLEFPLFGGCYNDGEYYYIAFGQENYEEQDNKEVIRLVQYTQNFERIRDLSVNGEAIETVEPFNAGYGKMASSNELLVFHTSRKWYKDEDGLNHQGQLTLVIDKRNWKIINELGKFQPNHVSHSFNQFVLFDGSNYLLLDHGDAYPRAIRMHKEMGGYYTKADIFGINGISGQNYTGVSIGGFEATASHYVVALNSIDQKLMNGTKRQDMNDEREIIICSLPKNNFDEKMVQQVVLTQYKGSGTTVSMPKLVKISDESLVLLWQEYDVARLIPGAVKYCYLDASGKLLDKVKTLNGAYLSNCQPKVINNEIVWYADMGTWRTFYKIPVQ